MKQTPMQELEKWISDYEKINGTPTMCEIKSQIELFKEKEKQVIEDVYTSRCTFISCEETKKDCQCGKNYYNETFKQK